eukprot:164322_1
MATLLFVIFTLKIINIVFAQNVLIIYCDDSGMEISPYKEWLNGNDIKTPNIQYLANHSMVFNYGYTSVSSCSPSRSALLTGMPVHQNGMYGLHHGVHHFDSFDVNSGDSNGDQYPLSIGRILKDNGYYTGIIGKYHVGPMNVYYFDYMITESNGYNLDQVGRNITLMNQYMTTFFDKQLPKDSKFLLYMAFHDTHRGCGGNKGPFCNFWGNGTAGMGTIPDWTPVTYNPTTIKLPYWMPDTPEARQDYVDYLEGYSRLDQGVGLFLKQLEQRGYLNDTIIIFSSDNGEPMPASKTNLYEEGQIEPYMVSIPDYWKTNNGPIYSDYLVSTTDVVPTVLDWCNIKYPTYSLNGKPVHLSGVSLLDIVKTKNTNAQRPVNVFGSHILHEVTMYYPMRSARNPQYRLIHNLNFQGPYHIAEDIYGSPTWQQLIKDANNGQPTHWFKNLTNYYFRPEYELYDIKNDKQQLNNLAYNTQYQTVFNEMVKNLSNWESETNDPWRGCNSTTFAC